MPTIFSLSVPPSQYARPPSARSICRRPCLRLIRFIIYEFIRRYRDFIAISISPWALGLSSTPSSEGMPRINRLVFLDTPVPAIASADNDVSESGGGGGQPLAHVARCPSSKRKQWTRRDAKLKEGKALHRDVSLTCSVARSQAETRRICSARHSARHSLASPFSSASRSAARKADSGPTT